MTFMPKLPRDIMSRTKSTQLQWVGIIFVWLAGVIYLLVAGFVYLCNTFGIIQFTFQDTIWITIVALVLIIFNSISNFKKRMSSLNNMDDDQLENLNNQLDAALEGLKNEMQKAVDEQKDGIHRKVVVIKYLDQSRPILVELKPVSDMTEEEIEAGFEKILNKNFTGLVISAEAAVDQDPKED